MSSVVDVCNSALDKLGHSPIISLDDGNRAAGLCKRNWPLVRDRLLRDHPWNFAVVRAVLAPADPPPEWGFESRFPFKSDHLRLLEVLDHSTGEYQVEGRSILANGSLLRIRYLARIDDPNQYETLFIDTLAARLAYELCEAVTQSNTKKEALWAEYEDALTRAKRADGQENPPQVFSEDEWIAVRY